jgi:hypothetical protein
MAAQTQQLEPTHRAYSTPSEGGGTRICLGFAYTHKDGRGFDVKLHAFPADGDISCRPIAERRKTKASGLMREKRQRRKQNTSPRRK